MNAPSQRTAIALAVTPTRLWLDLETFSETPIRDGTHRYAENAEILLFAYALDDGEVSVWDVTEGEAMPDDLLHALINAPEVWAHNSGFDRTVLRNVMPTLCPPIERWRDTMVQALAHSLPGALGVLSEVLGLDADDAKDKRGKQLVRLFCMPRKFSHQHLPTEFETKAAFKAAVAKAKAQWCGRATKETHPREWAEFISYAANDIKAMRVIERKLPKWNYAGGELALWHLDQRINDRGIAVDTELAVAAVRAVAATQQELAARTVDLTLGQVSSTNKRQALIDHLMEHFGVALEDLKGSTVEKRLEHADLDPVVRELLLVRLAASTSSTAKYRTLVNATSRDGRVRGLLQFNGASRTGRWCLAAGSLVLTLGSDGTVSETPIELVRRDDMVWDGDEWVEHEGAVYSGRKEVVEHDKVVATPEHRVYITTSECITLGEAKQQGTPLWPGNEPTLSIDSQHPAAEAT